MKRSLIIFVIFIICADYVFAGGGGGSSGGGGTCCHTTVFDVNENMTKNCGSLDDTHAPHNVYIQSGKVAFQAFPQTRTCWRFGGGSYRLDPAITNLCSGFAAGFASGPNRSKFNPVADVAGQCWRWQCNSGLVTAPGGECLTPEESCAKVGLAYRNGMCVPNWCSDWESGFNASRHYEIPVGGCMQYRCRSGTFFASATDRATCKACAPRANQVGGCFGNAPVSTAWKPDGVFHQCSGSQYVSRTSGGKWQCSNLGTTDDARIKACWKCKDMAALLKCLQNPGSPACE